MPFVVSNVEADEVHFVQEGELEFRTAYGTLTGEPGDFIVIPRGIPYRVRPVTGSSLSVIVETPGAVRFDPSPTFGAGLRRAVIGEDEAQDVETVLLLKSFDGVTRYVKPTNPLATQAFADGPSPVWKLNLRDVPTDDNGPPVQFITSPGRDELFYNLSARHRRRPPIHNNVDYDELIYYFEGPGAWGGVDQPGMLTCVPKGVMHHGPSEDVPEGYYAWMLESRCTLRLTDAGAAAAELMETDLYGPHASGNGR
jgi:homogentisate 1,2-dioxygenase